MSEERAPNGVEMREMSAETGPELSEVAAVENMSTHLCFNKVTVCEIITLPGLHKRKDGTMYRGYLGASALVIDFPVPRWRRNAEGRR